MLSIFYLTSKYELLFRLETHYYSLWTIIYSGEGCRLIVSFLVDWKRFGHRSLSINRNRFRSLTRKCITLLLLPFLRFLMIPDPAAKLQLLSLLQYSAFSTFPSLYGMLNPFCVALIFGQLRLSISLSLLSSQFLFNTLFFSLTTFDEYQTDLCLSQQGPFWLIHQPDIHIKAYQLVCGQHFQQKGFHPIRVPVKFRAHHGSQVFRVEKRDLSWRLTDDASYIDLPVLHLWSVRIERVMGWTSATKSRCIRRNRTVPL